MFDMRKESKVYTINEDMSCDSWVESAFFRRTVTNHVMFTLFIARETPAGPGKQLISLHQYHVDRDTS